jgi:hypothetical protein
MDCYLQGAVVAALQEFQMDCFHQVVQLVVLEGLLVMVPQMLQDALLVLVLQPLALQDLHQVLLPTQLQVLHLVQAS